MAIKIALAGNPNCGKTTLFNNLTGSNQYVGNWPGVTVEKKEGKLKGEKDVIIQDLPGIYSLSPYTLEEVVSRTYLVKEKPDAILNIIDGTNIERNLYLTTQLIELGIPVVMAVNMIDLVRKNGDKIDLKKLSKELGCQAVEISALKGEGTEAAAKAAIAAAKAGIIKPGCPVVSYGGAPEADAVLRRVAAQQNAPLTEVDFAKLQITGGDLDAVTFSFDGLDGVRLPLIGSYQPRNAALAITALRVLRQQGWNIPESAIRTGLEQVSWPGRFELLRHSPTFVLDGSHNAHGMRATVQSLKDRFPGQKFVFLVSIMADKDVDEMLALLAPLAERFVTVTAHNPRAMPAQTLAEHIRAYGCTAEAADSIEAGVARAEELGGEGPVCALGTLYFSGDVRQAFARLNA